MARRKKSDSTAIDKKKQEALVRIANRRVPKAIKALRICGNLARYSPTEEQADQILDALRAALKQVESQFAGTVTEEEGFSLQ